MHLQSEWHREKSHINMWADREMCDALGCPARESLPPNTKQYSSEGESEKTKEK